MSADLFDGAGAIVTGSGSGIGAALTAALTRAGATVRCTDVDVEAAQRTARGCGGPGCALAAHSDVTDSTVVAGVVDEAVARRGRIDLMVNNAAISCGGDTEPLTVSHGDRIIDTNIRGVVNGVAAAYRNWCAKAPVSSSTQLLSAGWSRQGRPGCSHV